MRQLKIFLFLIIGLPLFTTCKKQISVSGNPNPFGSIFGNGREHYLNEVLETPDGNYLLFGTNLGGTHGMFDGFALKVDPDFNVLWYKNYGSDKEDYFTSMAIDDEGNVLLVGQSYGFGISLDSVNTRLNRQFYLVYINKDGDVIWEKSVMANPSGINVDNASYKVNYLNNKTFCISGTTKNFPTTSGYNNIDIFSFCVDKNGDIKWSKRIYDTKSVYNYSCQNAAVCEDGNLLIPVYRLIDTLGLYQGVLHLVKQASIDSGYKKNSYIWKGPVFLDFFPPANNIEYLMAMASTYGNGAAIAEFGKLGMILTGQNGEFLKRVNFSKPIDICYIEKSGNQLNITGSCNTGLGKFPCWAITDLDGNIKKEVYPALKNSIKDKLQFKKIFFDKNNTVLVFGTMEISTGSVLVMLKFDTEGNLIKE